MPLMISRLSVEPVVRSLVGAIDVDGGPTAEQIAVLRAIVNHVWERADLDLVALAPLDPEQLAVSVTDASERRRALELMMLLELCRHPETRAQVERVEAYADALGRDGAEDRQVIRTWLDEGVQRATDDFDRFYGEQLRVLSEPSLRDRYLELSDPDLELARRLKALNELPEGTLGHAYVEFYRRNGITLPGADIHFPAHYVSHDMNHVITGYEPTGPEEIALGAFTLAMNDNNANWMQFLANLAIHEAGLLEHGAIMPKAETLMRPGATELLGDSLWRGAQCTSDFSQVEHLTFASWPLEEVRAHFGVPPRGI
jgi:hypothetical protein